MTTVFAPPSVQAQAQVAPVPSNGQADGRIVLYAVTWESYEKLLEALCPRRIRLTYDRGTLEIMTVSSLHDWWKRRIGFVLPLLGGVLNVEVQGYGSTTMRREDLERGLEPDEGFYTAHTEIRGPREIDLTRDPPPDLAIEVEISTSVMNRMGIYAALGVPEVWRFDGTTLRVQRLRSGGTYDQVARSEWFPTLPLSELSQFLVQTQKLSDTTLIGPFTAWARAHVKVG